MLTNEIKRERGSSSKKHIQINMSCILSSDNDSVTFVSTWAKAVPCVAVSVHVSMLYLNITFMLNTTEL